MITWNTGRHYALNCQRMAAEQTEKGIVFIDLDRGIHGLITRKDCKLNQYDVMTCYDSGEYEYTMLDLELNRKAYIAFGGTGRHIVKWAVDNVTCDVFGPFDDEDAAMEWCNKVKDCGRYPDAELCVTTLARRSVVVI